MVEVFQIDKPSLKFWRTSILVVICCIIIGIFILFLFVIFDTPTGEYIVNNKMKAALSLVLLLSSSLMSCNDPYLYKIILEDNSFTMLYYIYGIPFRKKITYKRCAAIKHTHTADYIIINNKYSLGLSYVDINVNKGWSREQLDEIIGILKEHGVVITRKSVPFISTKRKRKK